MLTNRLHTEGSSVPREVYLMRKQGYLPLLLHPHPQSVVEIGLGTGIGFTPVALDERVKEAEVVEISPGVVEAARFFAAENGRVLASPKVRTIVEDGRNYLLLTPRTYDLVILGLLTPYRWGTGYLFTRETYVRCRARLRPGAMVVQWLALNQLSLAHVKTVVRTFESVFPYVYLWDKGYYLALVGMDHELKLDFRRFRAALRSPSVAEDLRRWGLDDPYNFLASFLMGPKAAREFADGAPLNTEDRPRIEFSDLKVFRTITAAYGGENLTALLRRRTGPQPYIVNMTARDRALLKRYTEARGWALEGLVHEGWGLYETAYEYFRRARRINPKDEISRFALRYYQAARRGGGGAERP
jgi:spermidine synthase